MQYGSYWQTAAAIVFLAAVTAGVMTAAGLRLRRDFLGAAVRSIVQLAAVALIISWVFRHPEGTGLYLGVMLIAATATSVRRIRCGRRAFLLVMGPLLAGVTVAVVPVLATGALPLQSQTVLPFTAQILGGSMTAVSLAGSRMRDAVGEHWDIVEGYLALGASPRQAVREHGRLAAEHALIPGLDQTRSAGLVTLPGAFVGMLLGGATPAQAAQVQVLVLMALIAAGATAGAAAVWTLAPGFGRLKPEPVSRG